MKLKNSNNILRTLTLVLILPFVLTVSGCSSDDGDGDGDGDPVLGCNQLSTFSTEYLAALEDFQNNPSEATCDELRDVSLDFIETLQDCPEYYEQYSDLEEAIQAWTDLDCSDFAG